MRIYRLATAGLAALSVLTSGCASTGATFDSGVGDRFLDDAPFYSGRRALGGAVIAHLPIGFQRGATQPGAFDPSATPVGALLAEMNAYLDSLGVTAPMARTAAAPGTPPDVHFGCERELIDDECHDAPDRLRHRLAVGRPSSSWTTWAAAAAARADADHLLVITLEVGNYLPYQRDWRGSKEIRLGTGYTVDVPWLTALDRPASVLQLTGALMDRDGRAIRIGAEGLMARRTNVLIGGFGVQALISDEDVERVRTLRREDLPGHPLVWQVALSNMVAELTGRAGSALGIYDR